MSKIGKHYLITFKMHETINSSIISYYLMLQRTWQGGTLSCVIRQCDKDFQTSRQTSDTHTCTHMNTRTHTEPVTDTTVLRNFL